MNKIIEFIVIASLLITGAQKVMAIEEASYEVVKQDNDFEIRKYAIHVLAETQVDGSLKEAGNIAFKRLFGYISGDNVSNTKVSMTAPVSQQQAGEKIEMTAPVGQQRVGEKWVVSFMMPKSYTLSTLPQPEDASVTLREVPAQKIAAIRYSGTWSEENYLSHKLELETWIEKNNITITGEPIWARYNAPFTPWFLRRNEILIPIN